MKVLLIVINSVLNCDGTVVDVDRNISLLKLKTTN